MEIWKNVVNYEDYFKISNFGNVFSLRTNKILKQVISPTGYSTIPTKIGGRKGKYLCFKVHRLVAMAFLGNIENKLQVNHKDGNKQNNAVYNLEWCTNQENQIHARKTGLNKSPVSFESKMSKLKISDAEYIIDNYRLFNGKMTQRELGEYFGVSGTVISRAIKYIKLSDKYGY
jgi:predicted metal-binding transcription factor (methanogenesis marker protein 9)